MTVVAAPSEVAGGDRRLPPVPVTCVDRRPTNNGGRHEHHRRDRQRDLPLQVDIPDEALEDLRRRIAAVRWPSRELVADRS
jgi:hypothetical protein